MTVLLIFCELVEAGLLTALGYAFSLEKAAGNWYIAGYVAGGVFAAIAVISIFVSIFHKRPVRNKRPVIAEYSLNFDFDADSFKVKNGGKKRTKKKPATAPRSSAPKNVKPDSRQTKKAPAGKSAGQRKRGK